MSESLRQRIAERLAQPPAPAVAAFARMLAAEAGAEAVLFYGSNLRTGALEGVLDFYLLMPGPQREAVWPRVSYREWEYQGAVLRAKIATMAWAQFASAAAGRSRDTTIWARFVQPAALIWAASEDARCKLVEAVADCAITASRLAAALGPDKGRAEEYWRALFRATYAAEFRVEKGGREDSILSANRPHFEGLLPLAWTAAGVPFRDSEGELTCLMTAREKRRIGRWWSARRRLGKPLNLLRLAKAATTFEGAAAYAAWKVERHTGIALEVTRFREKHPLLAAPGALFGLWRAKRQRRIK